jgi:DHA1 family multidrug resistance protein-like MFS transporter
MRGNILVLTVSRVLWSISDSICFPYLSLYILSLGGTAETVGWVNAVGSLAAALLYPIGGYIADKAGRARLVGVSTLLYASSFVIFAFANSWEMLAVAYAYQQVVLFYMPALNAIMADSIPPGARGKVYSVTVAIPNAVRIISPYLGGYLIALLTLQPAMRVGYTIAFCIGAVVAFIRIKGLKETVVNREGVGRNPVNVLSGSYRQVFASLRWVFTHMRGYTLVAIILSFVGSLVTPFWIIYAKEIIGIDAYGWGVILLIGGVANTIMALIVGNLVDRIGPRKCMLISFVLAVPGMALFTYSTSFVSAMLVWVLMMFASAFLWIASSVFLADSIPRALRGRIMAGIGQGVSFGVSGGGYSSGFLLFIPMTIGNLVGGYIYEYNPQLPWLIQVVTLTLALFMTFFIVKEPEKAES